MKNKKNEKDLHVWEEIYSQSTHAHKNRYPDGDIIRFIMRNFAGKNRKNVRILDLGCGWGNNLKFLCEEGFDAWGVDGSTTACKHCRSISSNVVKENMASLSFNDEFFDVIIDRNSIQCNTIEIIQDIINEVYRILKPGGIFYSIILAQTNQPQAFHAYYLTSPKSKLSRKKVLEIFSSFTSLEIDYSKKTYDGGNLFIFQWHVTAKKQNIFTTNIFKRGDLYGKSIVSCSAP